MGDRSRDNPWAVIGLACFVAETHKMQCREVQHRDATSASRALKSWQNSLEPGRERGEEFVVTMKLISAAQKKRWPQQRLFLRRRSVSAGNPYVREHEEFELMFECGRQLVSLERVLETTGPTSRDTAATVTP